ncbi:MAG: molybdopterin-guanine dinucleotide biosynthesis protein B [Acidilobaceae archaeon]
MRKKLCIVQVVGPSASGKTTSIIVALRELKKRGVRVGVLKHTHHDIDVAHKDSWRFLNEGQADYSVVLMGSGEKTAVFAREWSLESVLEFLDDKVDVVLVEGFKDLQLGAKIDLTLAKTAGEAWRAILEEVEKCLESQGELSGSAFFE